MTDQPSVSPPEQCLGEPAKNQPRHSNPEQSASDNVIGEFQPFAYSITCEREPEVGLVWMACIKELSICALGDTPKEAGENLFKALTVGGNGKLYEVNCTTLEETGSTWRKVDTSKWKGTRS